MSGGTRGSTLLVRDWLSGHFWGNIPSAMFGGKISTIEVLIMLAILWVVVWLVRAAIRKLEKD